MEYQYGCERPSLLSQEILVHGCKYYNFFVWNLCMWTLRAVLVFFSTPQWGQECINPLKWTSACLLIWDLSELLLPHNVHCHAWLSWLYNKTSLMVVEKSKRNSNIDSLSHIYQPKPKYKGTFIFVLNILFNRFNKLNVHNYCFFVWNLVMWTLKAVLVFFSTPQ